ncbi:hypothetical protein C7B82_28350 [Stenomitos frigidus ULC18]|uniref:Uncharacterized protein n=2 Tax=Stenomitos TaxID=1844270 RepID=A0A2T1DUG2_9CYAN|nr:hypothetical protein C7B82_28350 [Stenomitos frigidus ULC18]
MWALQFHVKQSLKLFPKIKTIEEYAKEVPVEDKSKVREVMYADHTLIDTFLKDNPQDFSSEKLAIVEQWKNLISGDFYIERILKKYTIFIAEDDQVYGVWGLQNDFDEMFHPSQLPLLVRAVLLPFKDKIIYDGLLQSYNIMFGGGISGSLKETYLAAKQRGTIIERFTDRHAPEPITVSAQALKDWTPELAELVARASKLRGGGGQPVVYSPVFSLIKASLELGHAATINPNDQQQLWKLLGKVEQAVRKIERSL